MAKNLNWMRVGEDHQLEVDGITYYVMPSVEAKHKGEWFAEIDDKITYFPNPDAAKKAVEASLSKKAAK